MDPPAETRQNPSPAQWAVRPLKKYAVFSGRAPRAEYWWFYLAWFISDRILTAVDQQLFPDVEPLATLLSLAILVPWTALTIRRLHDIDRSGWWLGALALLAAAVVGLFVAGVLDESVRVTESPPELVALAIVIVAVLGFLVFLVTPGSAEPNRFGPDPYGPEVDNQPPSLAASEPV